jgi:epoxyqueuosine reductase
VIVTTVDFESTGQEQQDPCATCTRCIDACPTDAITPWSVDGSKCVSYLTIEHRSEVDSELFSGVGDWLFGCDICQEVCPHNQMTERVARGELHEAYISEVKSLDILEVLGWDEDERRRVFSGGSAMKRAKLGMMRRNAVIVAGNLLKEEYNEQLLSALKTIANKDEDAMVRNTAIAVLRLRK